MQDHDPILDAALDEALGGKTPPDLVEKTLARAASEPGEQAPKAAIAAPPAWRARGVRVVTVASGLAAGLAIAALLMHFAVVEPTQDETQIMLQRTTEPEQSEYASESLQFNTVEDMRIVEDSTDSINEDPSDMALGAYAKTFERRQVAVQAITTGLLAPEVHDRQFFRSDGIIPFVDTDDDRLSTFGLEHDQASYVVTRSSLDRGNLPPREAIRPEEFVNYFNYRYPAPLNAPFAIHADGAPSRYGEAINNSRLLRVGVQGMQIDESDRLPAVITLVVDVSGSMHGDHRIGLAKRGMEMLVNGLDDRDVVGIVSFGSSAQVVLEHTGVQQRDRILDAIRNLRVGGSTNAESGLRVGYELAFQAYREGSNNRVILLSDGVANTGVSNPDGLVQVVKESRTQGMTLSSLGFGVGHYNDHLLEKLGNEGGGRYAYIDSEAEARRMFTENLTGTIQAIARDVRVQVDFNPDVVRSFRLIGYANRQMEHKEFRQDKPGGGEIGAGHAATALYEIKLHEGAHGPVATITLRYREVESDPWQELEHRVSTGDFALAWELASPELRLAGNVAQFAEILQESFYAKGAELGPVLEDLQAIRPYLIDYKVAELLKLVEAAHGLKE